ncbi:MarR family transcriptional regulator [Acidithiobacillus ferrivorans]|uniref:MarR family transcriptional regulator n=1 Tax=Acidithiobacillus ferrivorans TaxID=160808 RepID=UPI0034CEABB4
MNALDPQDSSRILQCLQDGPKTSSEIAQHLRLSHQRVSGLIHELNRRGFIYAPRCTTGPRGNSVNLWGLRPTLETPA